MENWLASGDQIDAVASNNDEMAIGAIQAIEAAGKLGKILVGGVDASPDALAEMDKGRLNVTVFQNAKGQGEGGIKAAIALAHAARRSEQTRLDPLRARHARELQELHEVSRSGQGAAASPEIPSSRNSGSTPPALCPCLGTSP